VSADPGVAMKTVYINGKFSAQRTTGVQRFAHHIVQALDRQPLAETGVRWVLLCPPAGQPAALEHIQTRHVGPSGLPLHLWEQGVLPLAARDGLLLNLAGSAPMLAARQCVTLHDAAVFDHPEAYTWVFGAWYRALFRRHARHAAGMLTVSAFSQGRLARCLGVAPARIRVVYNGSDHLDAVVADESILDRHGLRGRRYLLAVGSTNPTKNLARLEAAFAQAWVPQDVLLVIVGADNPRVFAGAREVERPTTEGPLGADAARVLRTGPIDDAPLKALYQHALALVFPSTYEGFGLPPLEAMRCACPVAAAQVASIPEVCGEAALYFDPTAADDMALSLQRLLSEPALRQQLVAAGQRQAARFTWERAADCLVAELNALT